MSFGGAKDFGDSSAGTFGAGGAGTILEVCQRSRDV